VAKKTITIAEFRANPVAAIQDEVVVTEPDGRPRMFIFRQTDAPDEVPQPRGTVVLTREQVRELLAEGRLCRAEVEKRIERMERLTLEERFGKAR
jgi:hypothetical protein